MIVEIKLTKPEFNIFIPKTEAKRAELVITDARLHIMQFAPNAKFADEIQYRISKEPSIYHFDHWMPMRFTIPAKQSFFLSPDISRYIKPTRVYVFFVVESAAKGHINKYDIMIPVLIDLRPLTPI